VPILLHESNSVVCKDRKNDSTTAMMNDLSLVGYFAFLHGIHSYVENSAAKDLDAVNYSRKILICIGHLMARLDV
jgi:hypothetical protein